MRRISKLFICSALLALAACGPSVSNNGGDGGGGDPTGDGGVSADAYNGMLGTITGVVWAPGNAPGMVPAGHEIPIFDALVYVTLTPPAPIPQATYCEQCVDPPGTYVRTDHDGNFSLANLVPNTYWIIIEKGQFRIEQQIIVTAGQVVTLDTAQTTLPSVNDPANGKTIPKIAMAVGNYDDLEDILGKMGLGTVDGSGRYTGTDGKIDIYSNGGDDQGVSKGTLTNLVSDLNAMLQYHIIFIPCASTSNTSALDNVSNLRNIRDYVAAGGKLYVTDWSGEWHDNVFPAFVTLGGGEDTPANAYDMNNDTWNTSLFGAADGFFYDSDNAEAVDADLNTWLHGQTGPTIYSSSASQFDANNFGVEGNWNTIDALNTIQVGVDNEGLPVMSTPVSFIIGGDGNSTPKQPLTVAYEPAGCGRVLYSTYHTTDNTHVGLVPQERVLLYLIMEIGVCKSGPVVE